MAIITLNNNSLVNADVGKVLQVVSTSTTTAIVTTSTTYTGIGLELTITPSSTSNKIFLVYNGSNETNGASKDVFVEMLRDSTQIAQRVSSSFADGFVIDQALSKLDSPSTTSAITYKIQGKSGDGTVVVFNVRRASADNTGILTAYEIAG